ncbi:cytochrome P450 [Streptomyces sp.]|uniref:cytochrome P450 n=1 Tax=Streptomyces sp. TaxID=1931 RepID=UPI002D79B64B|nr:cytochrome P450 [Streptomyces sp.]HET6357769.1 cytochrome P450 [Streptomyces sp.]
MTFSAAARRAPAAPGALPLLGHGPALLRRPLDFLRSLPATGPVVRIRLGALPAYVVNDPGLVRSVLVGEAGRFDQGLLIDKARPLLGSGVGTANGTEHRRLRRLMQPAFHKAQIARYAATMTAVAAERTAAWRPGLTLRVDEELTELALTTVARALFSSDLGGDAITEVQRSLPMILDEIPRRAVLPDTLLRLPTPANRRFEGAVRRLRSTTRHVVEAARADGSDRGDLLSVLLLTKDEVSGERLTDDQVHDQLVNMLVAGTETTGATLAWIFHELTLNPAVEHRLHQETDQVLAGRLAVFEDIARLPYTLRVVQEALRRYAPWIILRLSPRESVLGEVSIPAGATVLFSPYVLHHQPRLYPDPFAFDPDRWLPERAANLPRGASIPFGAGSRQCPGNVFALTQMVIQVATIAARWRLRPAEGPRVRELARGAVVHPTAMPMRFLPRERLHAQERGASTA